MSTEPTASIDQLDLTEDDLDKWWARCGTGMAGVGLREQRALLLDARTARRIIARLERVDLSRRAGGTDPSSGWIELPDGMATRAAGLIRFHLQNADIGAADRAELATIADALDQTPGTVERISQSVGDLRLMVTVADNPDDRIEWLNALCAAVRAEAVADERQRIKAAVAAVGKQRHWLEDAYDKGYREAVSRCIVAAGSVPVATPQAQPDHDVNALCLVDGCEPHGIPASPVATPEQGSVAELARRCGECTQDGLGNCQHGCRAAERWDAFYRGGVDARHDLELGCAESCPCSNPRPGQVATPTRPRRYGQCDGTCTVDCGHCKGHGRPIAPQHCDLCGTSHHDGSPPGSCAAPPVPAEQPHPHGSVVEQVHRVLTIDQGVDPWVLAEEIVQFVRSRGPVPAVQPEER
jgi:hypothetical protein